MASPSPQGLMGKFNAVAHQQIPAGFTTDESLTDLISTDSKIQQISNKPCYLLASFATQKDASLANNNGKDLILNNKENPRDNGPLTIEMQKIMEGYNKGIDDSDIGALNKYLLDSYEEEEADTLTGLDDKESYKSTFFQPPDRINDKHEHYKYNIATQFFEGNLILANFFKKECTSTTITVTDADNNQHEIRFNLRFIIPQTSDADGQHRIKLIFKLKPGMSGFSILANIHEQAKARQPLFTTKDCPGYTVFDPLIIKGDKTIALRDEVTVRFKTSSPSSKMNEPTMIIQFPSSLVTNSEGELVLPLIPNVAFATFNLNGTQVVGQVFPIIKGIQACHHCFDLLKDFGCQKTSPCPAKDNCRLCLIWCKSTRNIPESELTADKVSQAAAFAKAEHFTPGHVDCCEWIQTQLLHKEASYSHPKVSAGQDESKAKATAPINLSVPGLRSQHSLAQKFGIQAKEKSSASTTPDKNSPWKNRDGKRPKH